MLPKVHALDAEYLMSMKTKCIRMAITGPEIIKLFPCSTQLCMKLKMLTSIKNIKQISNFLGSDKPRMLFFLLINVKMPTIVGILTFMSRKMLAF